MCKFKPFNKHLLVEKILPKKNPDLSSVLIPEDAKTDHEHYGTVRFIDAAADCDDFFCDLRPEEPAWMVNRGRRDDQMKNHLKENGRINLVVDNTMVEEVKIREEIFHIVHQNYVVGIVDE